MADLKEMIIEWRKLCSERIGFMRAGADGVDFDFERDRMVAQRIEELEKMIFPLLTERQTLNFNNTPRPDMWRSCDALRYSGWIEVESNIQCDQFRCDTVTGSVVFAKDPTQ